MATGFGLRLVKSQGMEGYTGNLNEFAISPANPGKIFTGDLVKLAGGFIDEASGRATGGAFIPCGVFMGCKFVDSDGSIRFRQFWDGAAGRTNILADVAQPPHGIFYIRGAAGTTYAAATTVGARYGIAYAAGSPMYGDSRVTLGAAVIATGPLIVHRLAPLPDNKWGNGMPIFEVSMIQQQLTAAVAA
jgi:catechol 2,3-dioxygenase-like lactoylglutathione lyase family enzyme